MKSLIYSTLFATIGLAAYASAQNDPGCCGQVPMPGHEFIRDAATHDKLANTLKKHVNPASKLRSATPESSAAASAKVVVPASLMSRSVILNRAGYATLIPKKAVLHVPSGLEPLMGIKEGDKIIYWEEFFRNNRAWIRTIEVTRAQAEGWEGLDPDLRESFKECKQLIVATYQTGPISVLKPDAPVPGDGKTASISNPAPSKP